MNYAISHSSAIKQSAILGFLQRVGGKKYCDKWDHLWQDQMLDHVWKKENLHFLYLIRYKKKYLNWFAWIAISRIVILTTSCFSFLISFWCWRVISISFFSISLSLAVRILSASDIWKTHDFVFWRTKLFCFSISFLIFFSFSLLCPSNFLLPCSSSLCFSSINLSLIYLDLYSHCLL